MIMSHEKLLGDDYDNEPCHYVDPECQKKSIFLPSSIQWEKNVEKDKIKMDRERF